MVACQRSDGTSAWGCGGESLQGQTRQPRALDGYFGRGLSPWPSGDGVLQRQSLTAKGGKDVKGVELNYRFTPYLPLWPLVRQAKSGFSLDPESRIRLPPSGRTAAVFAQAPWSAAPVGGCQSFQGARNSGLPAAQTSKARGLMGLRRTWTTPPAARTRAQPAPKSQR